MIILYPSVCYLLPFAIPSFIFPFSVFGSGGWQMYVRLYKSNCNLGAKETFLDAVAYPSLISSHPSPLPRILTNSHIMYVPHTCSIARVARFFLQIFFFGLSSLRNWKMLRSTHAFFLFLRNIYYNK